MNNIKAFKNLIKRYETITLDEAREAMCNNWTGRYAAKKLTGFGWSNSCTLCRAANRSAGEASGSDFPSCHCCVYGSSYNCRAGSKMAEATYDRISGASTPRKLINAFRARAKYMRTLIEDK